MARRIPAADLERSSERWLAWLAVRRPGGRARPVELLVLWTCSRSGCFRRLRRLGGRRAVAAPPDGRNPAANAVLVRHRQATGQLLEELARSAGVPDPAALASQLLILVEGAIAGALIDRHAGGARHGRELTQLALTSAGAAG